MTNTVDAFHTLSDVLDIRVTVDYPIATVNHLGFRVGHIRTRDGGISAETDTNPFVQEILRGR
jgi:hypothetical protein